MVRDFPAGFSGTLRKVAKIEGVHVTILVNVGVDVPLEREVAVGAHALHQALAARLRPTRDAVGITDPLPAVALHPNLLFVQADEVRLVVTLVKPGEFGVD